MTEVTHSQERTGWKGPELIRAASIVWSAASTIERRLQLALVHFERPSDVEALRLAIELLLSRP